MQKISRRTSLKTLAAGFAGAGAASLGLPRLANAQTAWNWYTYYPVSTGAPARGITQASEAIDKATNGQLKIRVHLGGSLPIQAATITPAVTSNVVQIASDIFSTGNVPIVGVLRLPMLVQSVAEYEKAHAIMMPYFEAAHDKKGLAIVGRYLYPVQSIWSRKKLTSLADLKDQKIRVVSPEQGEFIRSFGGSAVTMGTPEVSAALDRGVVDGVCTAASGGGYVWRDLLKYNLILPLNYLETLIIVNKEALAKLPADQQAAVRKGASEGGAWTVKTLADEEQELRGKMQAAGLVVTQAPAADVEQGQAKMKAYWDEWAKKQPTEVAEALVKVRAALGR